MNFKEFYEKNREGLSQCSFEEALRQAWQEGYLTASHEMYKSVLDGLRGPDFINHRRATTRVYKKDEIDTPT